MKTLSLLFAALLAVLTCGAQTDPPATSLPGPSKLTADLALTPPMGWNTWNKFACNISEKLIRNTADEMVKSGMRDAGYKYLVIDDCWHGERNAHGDIQADPQRFPSGIKALADYVHSKGLKFGIYSDAGVKTCAGRPGSRGHEYQDAAQYAAWGVDYLKFDWCNTGTQNAEASYGLMKTALDATGRPIVFSMCEWGTAKPWLWAQNTGNLWRTTGDIYDQWESTHTYSNGVMRIVDLNADLYPYSGPGHWNDPDMLEVGNGGMTQEEYRTHFSMWAMLAAPLMAGNDLTHMSEATRSILLNKDVIAVDQDKLGRQGRRIRKEGDLEVWSRDLQDGARCAILLNRSKQPQKMTLKWEDMQYPAKLDAQVRDLWAHKDLGTMHGEYTVTVPSHGVAMVRLTP